MDHPARRTRARWEPLEPRVLYSADPAPVALAGQIVATIAQPASEVAPQATQARQELVVIDARVQQRDALVADLQAQQAAGRPLTILLVGEHDDAIASIGHALAGVQTPFSAIHLIGHGESGAMLMGADRLDGGTVTARAGEFAAWSGALTADADLLLYGCDTGAGSAGDALVEALAALTGADVAASTDPTGAAAAGGNWTLERRTGAIETALAPDAAMQAAWQGLLTTTPTAAAPVAATGTSQLATAVSGASGRQVAQYGNETAVVWQEGTGKIILGRYDAGGNVIGNLLEVSGTDLTGTYRDPAVAYDGQGNLMVTWTYRGSGLLGGPADEIHGMVYQGGTVATSVTFVNFDAGIGSQLINGDDDRTADVAGLAGGGFVVVWTELGNGNTGDLYAARLDTSGTVIGSAKPIAVDAGNAQSDAAVTALADGGFAVAWDQDGGSGRGVWLGRFDASGNPVGTAAQISQSTMTDLGRPDIAADATGLTVVWREQPASGAASIVMRRFDLGVNALSNETLVVAAPSTNDDVMRAAVAATGDGGAWVAWTQRDGSTGRTAVFAQRYTGTGTAVPGVLTIADYDTSAQTALAIALTPTGAVTAAWGLTDASTPAQDFVMVRTVAPATAGIVVDTPDSTTTRETGASVRLLVSLSAAPTQNVDVQVTVPDASEGTASTATLTFTPTNWWLAQTVTVTGVDDTIVDPATPYTVQLQTASADPVYATPATRTVALTNTDNDLTPPSIVAAIADAAVTTVSTTVTGDASTTYRLTLSRYDTTTAQWLVWTTVSVTTDATGSAAVDLTDTPQNRLATGDRLTASVSLYDVSNTLIASSLASAEAVVETKLALGGSQTVDYNENLTVPVATFQPSASPSNGNNNGTPSWSLGGDDKNLFTIDSAGVLRFVSPPNYEAPGDKNGDNLYQITVQYDSGQGGKNAKAKIAVTVRVQNVDEAPVLNVTSSTTAINENTQTVVTGIVPSDPDGTTQPLTVAVAGTGGKDNIDAALFETAQRSDGTWMLRFRSPPDFETPADANKDNVYLVAIVARDAQGVETSRTAYAVTVVNVNEPTTLTGPASQSLNENSTRKIPAGNFKVSDPDANQQLRVTMTVDGGSLTIGTRTGLSFTQGDGSADAKMTFTGSVSQVQAALNSITYTPNANWYGKVKLTVGIADPGDGSMPAVSTTTTMTVNALPQVVNDTGLAVRTGDVTTIGTDQLKVRDPDQSNTSKLVYTVNALPAGGEFRLNGVALDVGSTFTQSDVDSGRLTHVAMTATNGSGALALTVSDSQNGSVSLTFATSIALTPGAVTGAAAGTASGGGAGGTSMAMAKTDSTTSSGTTSLSSTSTSSTSTSSSTTSSGGSASGTASSTTGTSTGGGSSGQTAPAATGNTAGGGAAKVADAAAPTAAGDAGTVGMRSGAEPRALARGASAEAGADARGGGGAGGYATTGGRDAGLAGYGATADLLRRAVQGGDAGRDAWRGLSPLERAWMPDATTPSPILQVLKSAPMTDSLSRVKEQAMEQIQMDHTVVASSAAVTTSLTIGYAIWLLRGGVLLSSLLASVPAWRAFDPLPILANPVGPGGKGGEDDSLQGMLKRAAAKVRGGDRAPAAEDAR